MFGRTIMEDELQRTNHEKKKLKKDINALSIQLKSCVNVLIYSVLFYKISFAYRSRLHPLSKRHDEKLFNLRREKDQPTLNNLEK